MTSSPASMRAVRLSAPGRLAFPVDRVYDGLEQVPQAHDDMEHDRATGKLVVRVRHLIRSQDHINRGTPIRSAHTARCGCPGDRYNKRMGSRAAVVLYVLALVAVVVGVDILFFRHHFWDRLIVNVGIVLVFAASYVRFLKH
jgi:Zinc-binding dehydrogenase